MSYRLNALEPLKHIVDAMLTWAIGLVSGVQDVTATLDMAHCRLPDFYMQVSLKPSICPRDGTSYLLN